LPERESPGNIMRRIDSRPQRRRRSTVTRTASARYEGLGKPGKGHISSQSGVLDGTPEITLHYTLN